MHDSFKRPVKYIMNSYAAGPVHQKENTDNIKNIFIHMLNIYIYTQPLAYNHANTQRGQATDVERELKR